MPVVGLALDRQKAAVRGMQTLANSENGAKCTELEDRKAVWPGFRRMHTTGSARMGLERLGDLW